jgi:hypothetical protein
METQRATLHGIAETDVGVLGGSVRPPSTEHKQLLTKRFSTVTTKQEDAQVMAAKTISLEEEPGVVF